MARSGLDKNRKFLRLARRLDAVASGMGEIMARGILETLWSAAYERADDHLGDADDVEIAAKWRGEHGMLTAALLTAGGDGVAGFIEPDQERGGYRIHDLWDHAPPWVKKKAEAESARKAAGKTLADVRREAGKKGAQKSKTANGQQTVDQLPANGQQTVSIGSTSARQTPALGRDGTGRDGTGFPPVVPQGTAAQAPLELATEPTPEPPPVDLGEPENEKQRRVVDARLTDSLRVLAAVNEARRRVRGTVTGIRPAYTSLGQIAKRLASGKTVDECLRVVASCESECRREPDSFQWFNSVTPFRADPFELKLAAAPTTDATADAVRRMNEAQIAAMEACITDGDRP